MKFLRRARAESGAAQALRALIRAEMAHEHAALDEARAAELQAQVQEALARHRRLTSSDA